MNRNIIFTISPEEFQKLISQALRNVLEQQESLVSEPKKDDQELIDVKQAMAILKISRETLSKWMKLKRIRYLRLGRKIFFMRQWLLDALELKY